MGTRYARYASAWALVEWDQFSGTPLSAEQCYLYAWQGSPVCPVHSPKYGPTEPNRYHQGYVVFVQGVAPNNVQAVITDFAAGPAYSALFTP